jgi:type I restriction enzyme R subunit
MVFSLVWGRTKATCIAFQTPPQEEEDSKGKLKREKRAVLEKLAAQEAQMAQILADLETARRQAKSAEKTASELQCLLNQAQQAANILEFSEEETRYRLIDEQLLAAGWDVGPRKSDTETVRQEFRVSSFPLEGSIGFSDYVLWDTEANRPIAVIEAKRTAHDASKGKTQAALYADAIEREHGFRPVISLHERI